MGVIKIQNISVYAYHGCLIEEAKIGSHYRVDLSIDLDVKKSAQSDKLEDTVDYVRLNYIVKQEMSIRANLLENVAYRINKRILKEFPIVNISTVEVCKICPPIGGNVEMATVELTDRRKK